MNREIKFRGQRVDNKEWIYGSLMILVTGYYIVPTGTYYNELIDHDMGEKITLNTLWEHNDFYEVIPETVGQYTGFLDKNGREIYEGDIIAVNAEGNGSGVEEKISTFVIEYNQMDLCWNNGFGAAHLTGYGCITHIAEDDMSNIEVVGNIYQDAETFIELD